MDDSDAIERFRFLAEAFDGSGGFRPRVTWHDETVSVRSQTGAVTNATRRVPKIAGPCHLVPHQRESAEKFAARAAVAVYVNHLREACERFSSYLGRRPASRQGADGLLAGLFVSDCDMRGTPLTQWMRTLALHLRARGSMLILIDMPAMGDDVVSLLDQAERRAVPYLRMLKPEHVRGYSIDPETGRLRSATVATCEEIDGEDVQCLRKWGDRSWSLMRADTGDVIREGKHPFGRCPVIAVTESGDEFPSVGKYAQIADASRHIFNSRSRLDELLGAQTFSLLTLQIPPEAAGFDVASAVATIGTSSMLTHAGATPAFISPDQGNAETYMAVIDGMTAEIRRIGHDEAGTESGGAESGVARRLRFERLNADLASFARQLQAAERQIWALFARALGITNTVTVEYPTDYNLVDTATELDILVGMSGAGFPESVLVEKRRAIAAAEFDGAEDRVRAAVDAAISEQAQERQ